MLSILMLRQKRLYDPDSDAEGMLASHISNTTVFTGAVDGKTGLIG